MTDDTPAAEDRTPSDRIPSDAGSGAEARTGSTTAAEAGGETPEGHDTARPGTPPWSGPGLAGRYGLVRPADDRYVAGVCAAVARVTNTDPVLWRVLVAVLTLFGGIGLLLYLLGWLLIPAEGDSAAPLESLLGRGRSNTSPTNVILLTVLTVLVFVFVFTDGFRVAVLGAVAVIAALVLFGRDNAERSGSRHAAAGGPPSASPPPPPPPPPAPAPMAPPPPMPSMPQMPSGGYPPPPPGGYRPPFAPHGPYASSPPPPPPPPRQVRPPKPPRERSRLGRTVLSLACLATGVVALVDLALGKVQASTYIAVAITVIGLGLLVGAWLGRARWLIPIGLVLSGVLGIVSIAEHESVRQFRDQPTIVWQPQSTAEMDPDYRLGVGRGTLDLRDVDFTAATEPVRVNLQVDLGYLLVLLPPEVDVDISADLGIGEADVLGRQWGGIDTRQRLRDNGPDGTGGGNLVLIANINAGNLEVRR